MARCDKLRVFHVTGCLDVGGQEKLLVEFARHVDRSRFDLHFVSLEGRGPLARDLEAEGWPVTALDAPPGLRPRLVLQLARLFRSGHADVVHTHNERPLIYAAGAARLAGVTRIIHTRHGRGAGISRRQRWLSNLAARAVDRHVCVSDDAARLAVEQGLHAARVETLHNGIDTSRFAFVGPRAEGAAVTVARLVVEKDIGTLLHAVALVVHERPTFRLAIAGDGPCMPELRQLAMELGLAEHVQFLGMVRDVAGLLAQSTLFVLSSVTEGVSLTLLEAMACGLPVVATGVGGTPEVVVNGMTGFVVPPRDAAALALGMTRLVDDPNLARRFGAAGRRRVERHFDIRRMVADYERMYVGEAPNPITEDRDVAVDNRTDGPDGRCGDARRPSLVAAARD